MIGVKPCCCSQRLSSSWASRGIFTTLPGTIMHKSCLRSGTASAGLRLLSLSLLSLAFAVSLTFWEVRPTVALADEIPSPAQEVLKELLMQAFTNLGDTENLHRDLAWRWFTHPDKRSKVPLVPSSSWQKPLSWWVEQYPEKGPESLYLQWATDYDLSPFFHGYTLVGFSDGADWDSTSINRDRYYEEWYNYFEDVVTQPDTNAGTFPRSFTMIPEIGMTQDGNNGTPYSVENNTVVVTLGDNAYNQVISRIEEYPYVEVIMGVLQTSTNPNNASVKLIQSKNPITLTFEQTNNNYGPGKEIKLTVSSLTSFYQSGQYRPYHSGVTTFEYNATTNNTYNNQNWYGITGYYTYGNGDISIEPSEPVYPPTSIKPIGPIEPDLPTEPTYTEITNNYYEVTETDVDLQPVIDAIGKVNKNIQILAGNIDTLNDNIIDGFQTISNWFDLWKEYTTALYDDLTDYLWRIERLLNALLQQEVSEPNIEPALGPDESLSDSYDVNLELLKKKFPTSIPWDIYGILRLLNAPAQAPRFELPVVLTEYTVVIDFAQYETMAAVSRKMSVLLFAVGLLMVTKTLASIDIGAHHGN